MDEMKRQRLESAGWKVGTVEDFLGHSPVESEIIELKLKLSQQFKQLWTNQGITQKDLAKLMNSSQSRISKIEAGYPSISFDLLIRALLYVGAKQLDIAQAIARYENSTNTKSDCSQII